MVYLSFSPDSETLAAGNVEGLGLWNLTSGDCTAVIEIAWFKRFLLVLGIIFVVPLSLFSLSQTFAFVAKTPSPC